jgi:dipeptidyl aminopeptidase/acylaminoacyl peptidase
MWRWALAVVFVFLAGCSKGPDKNAQVAATREIAPGVELQEVTLESGRKLWIYVPKAASGQKVGCVFVAPAGSPMVHGIDLSDGDRPEHLPYAQAGYAVVAYEVSGAPSSESDDELFKGAREFKEAEGGVADARAAIDYAIAHVPNIDKERLYTSGHSSAGTISLLVAAREPRVKGCIAFAAVPFVDRDVDARLLDALETKIPGFTDFIRSTSPSNNVARIKCPVFLFHAEDDATVSVSDALRFATDLRKVNKDATFVTVASGGHYDSMIIEGIPKAIEWLKGR